MEWQAPAIILAVRAYGDADALVTVLTQEQGATRGLVRGGLSRARAAIWQPGNLIEAQWTARLADQLGSMTGELVHPGAAVAMDDPLALATLASACAVAEGALPEREQYPRAFIGLLHLVAHIDQPGAVADLVRWEAVLLAELGYGLDLSQCAVTGEREALAFVSPRTGRAVTRDAAGQWQDRLLALPELMMDGSAGAPEGWLQGLRLTGHFLARDAFGHHHRAVPPARDRLEERIARLAA